MIFRILPLILMFVTAPIGASAASKKVKIVEPSPLDKYIEESAHRGHALPDNAAITGSLWSPTSRLVDLGSDVRATQVDDIVTVLVAEQASAVVSGTTKTARNSSAKASVSALAGITKAAGPWANLAGASSNIALDGQGSTTRQTALSTNLSARITHVLPNGNLVVEGSKDVQVNSERQIVTVRGVIRNIDLSPGNVISSDKIAQMEVKVNGKGVIGDAIRRPNILYRMLLGILPF
ncbi:MAG: flagellar basal body L-ring protein FlgH [Bryobacteraceae bacterium]